jgi:hypothetical protein
MERAMRLHRYRLLRRLLLPLLAKVNPGDIHIGHHWVPGRKVFLHSFKHKGQWYHGGNRE